jgi:hypothetical protein
MPVSPYLSLIIPAYNEAKSIDRTLDAVQTYLDQQPYSYEIIVAADGDDGTRRRLNALVGPPAPLTAMGTSSRALTVCLLAWHALVPRQL